MRLPYNRHPAFRCGAKILGIRSEIESEPFDIADHQPRRFDNNRSWGMAGIALANIEKRRGAVHPQGAVKAPETILVKVFVADLVDKDLLSRREVFQHLSR